MCGIAGIVNLDGRPVDGGLLRRMTEILTHRGPDGDGYRLDGAVGLGHRRLAIRDLVNGAQPMGNDDGAVWITYNGEIYNCGELREELEGRGVAFRTASDTEAVLRAYEAYGVDCLGRLRGMFAFAIWDARRRQVFLARDRMGIKPLVYAWDGRRFLFASEIKALLQDARVSRDLDWSALRDYLAYHYVPDPRTIFRAIRKLEPGSYLLLSVDRGNLRTERYWDLRFAADPALSAAEWAARLRDLLAETVRLHMVADVPIGAFLSGGVDSGSVVALMAQASPGRIRTFSIGFDEGDFDELAYAREVARRYGTEHCEYVVKPDALEVLPRLAWQFDEPFADSSAIPTYYVSRITRDQVTVALSGDGGDENFAGYGRYARALALHRRMDSLPASLARPMLRGIARLLPAGARGRGYLKLLGLPAGERYVRMVSRLGAEEVERLLTQDALALLNRASSRGDFCELMRSRSLDYVSSLQYLDMRTYLPGDILTKVDRTSMLVSLEARVPLLDHVLVEFAARMPADLKLKNGNGKAIFKQSMARDLPESILRRRKMGFGVPLAAWLRRDLAGYSRDVLLDRRARERGLFDISAVDRLLEEHGAGERDRSSWIWSLLCFEEWARRWLDR